MPNSILLQKYLIPVGAVAGILAGIAASPANAQVTVPNTLSITDGNAEYRVDPPFGSARRFRVDGVDHLSLEAFLFNIGTDPASPEQTLEGGIVSFSSTTNTFTGTYNALGGAALVNYNVELDGGELGSGDASIFETLTLTNTSGIEQVFSVYSYNDFDIGNTPDATDDTTSISGNTVTFAEPGGTVATVTVDQTPTFFQLSEFPPGEESPLTNDLLVVNPDRTILNNFGGPLVGADADSAFQFDFTLAAGETFTLNQQKQISVPEPGSVLGLLAVGALGAGSTLKRKQKQRAAAHN